LIVVVICLDLLTNRTSTNRSALHNLR